MARRSFGAKAEEGAWFTTLPILIRLQGRHDTDVTGHSNVAPGRVHNIRHIGKPGVQNERGSGPSG